MNTWIKLIFMLILIAVCSNTTWHQMIKRFEKEELLPECEDETSICGYFQLNLRGLSQQKICRCKNFDKCLNRWDPYDKRSIMHGTDQYKYCVQKPILKICNSDEIAYTSFHKTHLLKKKLNKYTHRLLCHCPADRLLVKNETKLDEYFDMTIISTFYNCREPPICGPHDTCMAISLSPYSSFNTQYCTCPTNLFCPYNLELAAEKLDLDKGSIFKMKCV